jgi:hypothetical protein
MTQVTQSQNTRQIEPYWEKFEQLKLESRQPSWLFPIRKAAISRFAELGFPTTHDEDWRFTNVAPIANLPFKPVSEYSRANLDAAAEDLFAGIVRWCSGDQPHGGAHPAVPWRCIRRPCRRSNPGAEHEEGAKSREKATCAQGGCGHERRFRCEGGAPPLNSS